MNLKKVLKSIKVIKQEGMTGFSRKSFKYCAKKTKSDLLKKIYHLYIRKPFYENNININHAEEYIFIHNPKTAGTSIKSKLGLDISAASHLTPTELVHKKTWEKYFSFMVVRHPIDRFISSFFYHTNPDYKGNYLKKYPQLHNFSIEQYFYNMKTEPHAIIPQINYIIHNYSNRFPDQICRFERLAKDINIVFNKLNLKDKSLPYKNKSNKNFKDLNLDKDFVQELIDYYKADFIVLGYSMDMKKIIKKYSH